MARTPTLTLEDLRTMMGLLKGADSVELKATLDESQVASAAAALDADPLDAQVRQVFFLDTPDLTLSDTGVVVRARRVQGKKADTVVKLRPVEPATLSKELRRNPAFGVEVDAMPGGYVCSASLKGANDNETVRRVTGGAGSLRSLFTKEQRRLYAAHAPDGLAIDDLSVLGPIFVLKLKWSPQGAPAPLVAEMWLYPDGSRIVELSTKCAPMDAFELAADVRTYLSARGIDLSGGQQTKTKKAMAYFSKRLQASPA
jgi:hypothetical protein